MEEKSLILFYRKFLSLALRCFRRPSRWKKSRPNYAFSLYTSFLFLCGNFPYSKYTSKGMVTE